MTDYHIYLVHTTIHKFAGVQLYFGRVAPAFVQGDVVPDESIVDMSIHSTFIVSRQGRFLHTHFQIDDIRLPEDENNHGYHLRFCLFAVFEVGEAETEARAEQFAQTYLPNLLAPMVSDNHNRFVAILQSGIAIPRLQPHIPIETIRDFIGQNKITFDVVTEANFEETVMALHL
jgi:hypothetical protein